jgi:type IV pilus assembly protein PilC
MPRYEYKAYDEEEREHNGIIDGASEDDALEKLSDLNFTPITIDELNFDGSKQNDTIVAKVKAELKRIATSVSYKEVVFYTRQLATMLDGGVPLARALSQLAKAQKPGFKKIIEQVANDISFGHTYSEAISRHRGAFSNMYVSLIHSGEISGALERVMEDLATYMENIEALKAKVKVAMRYPTFITGFVVLLVIGILWKLVPQFAAIYGSFGAELPRPTLILVMISDFIVHNMLWIIIASIIGFILFRVALFNEKFHFVVDVLMLKIPVFGMILKKNILAVYCRTMSLLMSSGTPILYATEISGTIVNNRLYSRALKDVHASLRQGNLLSQSLEKTNLFPILVTQLVATGEESGKVDALLLKATEFYEREIRNTVDSLAAIIEPFLIIILGGVVGSILIALYLPIFMIGKLLK